MLRAMPCRFEGLGPATITQLVDKELVRDVADLYTLEVEGLSKLDRMGVPSARNLVQQIKKSKAARVEKVLFGPRYFSRRRERRGTLNRKLLIFRCTQ